MTIVCPKYAQQRPAVNILRSMGRLLARRHTLAVNRRDFLKKWRKLRKELATTIEYQAFRRAVIDHAGGICERCGDPGFVVHHKRQMSFYLRKALDPACGELLCRECHKDEHAWLSREA